MKKLRLALATLLSLVILTGCGLLINYRGKLESKIGPAAEKVYPTKIYMSCLIPFPKGSPFV